MDSPVPASMFAPEPSSPGAARAASAAARLHDGFDSDCSEDGEALNGEPELDLTNKVGPGAGIGAKWDQVPRGPGGGPSRFPGDSGGGGGRGRARPPAGGDSAGCSGAMGGPERPPHRRPSPSGSDPLPPPGSRGDHNPSAPPRGTRVPDTGRAPRGATSSGTEGGPRHCPWQRGSAVAWEREWRRWRTRSLEAKREASLPGAGKGNRK